MIAKLLDKPLPLVGSNVHLGNEKMWLPCYSLKGRGDKVPSPFHYDNFHEAIQDLSGHKKRNKIIWKGFFKSICANIVLAKDVLKSMPEVKDAEFGEFVVIPQAKSKKASTLSIN